MFKQLFDPATWTYTYLIADDKSKEAAFIDPVNTELDIYLKLLKEHGLKLIYSFETHVHADHITAGGLLRQHTGAKTCVSKFGGAQLVDIEINDGDVFMLGEEKIKAIPTPGHTPGCTSFLWNDRLFSGDSLFISGCGRTDFQGGDAGSLYDAITQRLFTLPGDTLVYPGHDYQQRWVSNIEQERTANPRLAGKTREQFIEIMNNLNLPAPRLIDQAVPANRYCGLDENERTQAVQMRDVETSLSMIQMQTGTTGQDLVTLAKQHINEVNPEMARNLLKEGDITLIDTREESEFAAGHIDNAVLIPRGTLEFKLSNVPELADKTKPVLIYCRTGGRSALAAQTLQTLGYTNVLSLAGGFEGWNK
jgi:glyoxylase-like metal-dependent hydrolase (beta-lactamase superfamily II)/rhodanese-related sulfurtransferase